MIRRIVRRWRRPSLYVEVEVARLVGLADDRDWFGPRGQARGLAR